MSNRENVTIECRPSQATRLIKVAMKAKEPVMLWGGPGIGKSDIVRSVAKSQNRAVIDIRLLLKDPTDLCGIPYFSPTSGLMEWAHPKDMPMVATQQMLDEAIEKLNEFTSYDLSTLNPVEKETALRNIKYLETNVKNIRAALELQNAILFFDEIVSAQPSVMAAGYQLMLDRKIGDYTLPEHVDIICAGNRQSDRGVVNQMPSPLKNRLVHLNLRVDFEDWQQWAITNKIHHDVVGFLSQHKHRLYDFDPKSGEMAFATPRSWNKVSNLIIQNDNEKYDRLNDDEMNVLVAGTVGDGNAHEFLGHRKFAAKLPKVEDVLTGVVTKLEVDSISAQYSLAVNMCYTLRSWGDVVNGDSVLLKKYTDGLNCFFTFTLENMSPEMCVLSARTMLREFKLANGVTASSLAAFKEFSKKYGRMIMDD